MRFPFQEMRTKTNNPEQFYNAVIASSDNLCDTVYMFFGMKTHYSHGISFIKLIFHFQNSNLLINQEYEPLHKCKIVYTKNAFIIGKENEVMIK